MMTLTVRIDNEEAINAINRVCLVNNFVAKCHYSKVTNNVIYAFADDYPKGLEGKGVEYQEVETRL